MSANSDLPEFDVTVDDQGRVRFAHQSQARAYLRAKFAGQCIVAQFYEHRAKRSSRQNRAFHACISPWALKRGWRIEDLKQFILSRAFGWQEFVDPTTGEVIKVLAEPHTSTLSVQQFVLLIDTALELAAEDGEYLLIGDEYLKAKQAAERAALKKDRAARKGKAA